MKTLQEFLNANLIEGLTKEVPISERLKDENGELYKFKIRTITHEEVIELRTKAAKHGKDGKTAIDAGALDRSTVIAGTLEPNFKDAESLKAVGAATPEQYLNKVLLAGEVEKLAEKIGNFSGFNQNINELIKEAKN